MSKNSSTEKRSVQVGLRMTSSLRAALDKAAHSSEQTVARLVEKVLTDYLEGNLYLKRKVAMENAEGRISPSFTHKLCAAVHTLAGEGELTKRLAIAGSLLVQIEDHEVPEGFREEFEAVRASLFKAPVLNRVPRELTTETAAALSRRIVDLFADALGGV